jgi:Holliday junction DNA helicase RuvB
MPGASPYERDVKFEDSLRPGSFDEFIGQKKAVANLQIAIKAARKRKEALDHVLFSGLPGLGKTTLARLIAYEMKGQLHTTMGPILKRPGDLVGTLTKMEEGDILFIDECHRMLPDVEEFLYSAMEDFQISISMESGLQGRTINLPLKKFTLVGATTREGLLSEPFRARFGILEKLEWYPTVDLVKILQRSARILKTDIDEESAGLLGQRAPRHAADRQPLPPPRPRPRRSEIPEEDHPPRRPRGPRHARRRRRRPRRHGPQDPQSARHQLGPRRPQGPSPSPWARRRGRSKEVYEPYLIQNNFLVRTSRGRKATEKAAKHLGAEPVTDEQGKLF